MCSLSFVSEINHSCKQPVVLCILQPSVKYPPISSFWIWIPGLTLSCSVEFHPAKSSIDFHRTPAFKCYSIIHNTSMTVFFVLTIWPVHYILKEHATCYCSIKDELNIDFMRRKDSQSNVNTCVKTLYLTLTLSCPFSLYCFINNCVHGCRSTKLLLFSQ